MENKRYAVVLAAGEGTRMKSKVPKVLHTICGTPMIQHVVDQAVHLRMDRSVVVVSPHAEGVRQQLGDAVDYAVQDQQWGTAHAVMQADELLAAESGTTVVLYGDTPLITAETIDALTAYHEANEAKATILTSVAKDPAGYGRIVRSNDGAVRRIVEDKDATDKEKQITEINTGIYCFDNQALFQALQQVDNQNAQGEYYLPDAIAILKQAGEAVTAYQTMDFAETLGVNDRVQLAEATRRMKKQINKRHMQNGVTLIDPEAVYIDSRIDIGPDTVIEPGTLLQGDTCIGSDCHIGPHTQIKDSTVGDRTVIEQSVVANSAIGSGVTIGPFAHIRPESDIGDDAKVGNFVETKNTQIGQRSKASHLGYIGDAHIGRDVNFSCGAITVNYDGQTKHVTEVADGAMIGCNVNLVAPVTVGKDAFVAAGSTITDPVPEEALSIARSRQTTKENYAHKTK